MSPLQLTCPACGRALRVPGAKPGSRVKCPRCGEVFAPPATADEVVPAAEVVAAPEPAAQPVAAPAAPTDDDVFAKIAAADDPIAAAAEARKPQQAAPGEPGNPLPLEDDAPPPKARPVAPPRAAPTGTKATTPAKKRRTEQRDESRGAISPVWLLGGLGVLAVGLLAVGATLVVRHFDRKAEDAAEAARREAAAARDRGPTRDPLDREREALAREREELRREREAFQREREAAQNAPPKADPVRPNPDEPGPAFPGMPGPGAFGPAPVFPPGFQPAMPNFPPNFGAPPNFPGLQPNFPGMPPNFPIRPPVRPPFNQPGGAFNNPFNPPGGVGINPPAPADPPAPPVVEAPPAPRPKGGGVLPAANPAKITPTKAEDKTEIKLPGAVDLTCFGGGGRYVLMRIPSVKQVAVLDVCAGKVSRYLPLPEEGALIAAGNEHLFVLAPTDNVIQRWNLTTLEKERTAANPLQGEVRGLLVGHATDGPLFVVGPNKALDTRTFKEVPLGGADGGRGPDRGWVGQATHVNVSADGRVYAWHVQDISPSGLSATVVGPAETKTYHERATVGVILPGPDGTLFTAGGLFTPELKPVGKRGQYQVWHHAPIPAAHGPFYLTVAHEDDTTLNGRRAAPKVWLRVLGEDKPLLDLTALAGLDVPAKHNQATAKGLQLHNRVFLVPDAKAVAVLHGSADTVTIHALDPEAALEKVGIDYLFVTGRPPGAVRGAAFRYTAEVRSRKGGVKVKLASGPDGMAVDADGTVTWAVPAAFAEASASVVLTVSDASGRETTHAVTGRE